MEAKQNSMQPGLGLQLDSGQSWLQTAWGCNWTQVRAQCNRPGAAARSQEELNATRPGAAGGRRSELAATGLGVQVKAKQNSMQPTWGCNWKPGGRAGGGARPEAATAAAAASRVTAARPVATRAGPGTGCDDPAAILQGPEPGTCQEPTRRPARPSRLPLAPLTASGAHRPSPPCCTAASFLPSLSLCLSVLPPPLLRSPQSQRPRPSSSSPRPVPGTAA